MNYSDELLKVFRGGIGSGQSPPAIFGLTFPSNLTAGSDIGLQWSGPNLLPRETHTVIWDFKPVQQTGYYANVWHCSNDGTFKSDSYEYGTHPYPSAAGAVDGNGQVTDGTSSSGTVHFWEIAGLNAIDHLASPGDSALLVTKGQWYTQARTAEQISGNTAVRHKFYPDVINNPSFVITWDVSKPLSTPVSPIFRFGTSPWRSGQGGATSNDECPSGTMRNFALFNAAMTISDITLEAANVFNTAVTASGQAAKWYINKNPTVIDTADKSGQGHDPAWATASRPTLYTG